MKKTILYTLIILVGFGCTKLDEELYDRVKDRIETEKMLIKIPYRFRDPNFDDGLLESVLKDTIGGNIKI